MLIGQPPPIHRGVATKLNFKVLRIDFNVPKSEMHEKEMMDNTMATPRLIGNTRRVVTTSFIGAVSRFNKNAF